MNMNDGNNYIGIWADNVDFEDNDEDLDKFLLGDQNSKKSHVKHSLSYFNKFLNGKVLPEFESAEFSHEFVTQKLLTGFVQWFCDQDVSLWTIDKYVSALKMSIVDKYEDTLETIFLQKSYYKQLRKSFTRAVVERCKLKGVKVKYGAPCLTLEQLRYVLGFQISSRQIFCSFIIYVFIESTNCTGSIMLV